MRNPKNTKLMGKTLWLHLLLRNVFRKTVEKKSQIHPGGNTFHKKPDLDIGTITNTHSLESIPENDSLRYIHCITFLIGFAILWQYQADVGKSQEVRQWILGDN